MGEIKDIAEKAFDETRKAEAGPGDYEVDGILHCGKCKDQIGRASCRERV